MSFLDIINGLGDRDTAVHSEYVAFSKGRDSHDILIERPEKWGLAKRVHRAGTGKAIPSAINEQKVSNKGWA